MLTPFEKLAFALVLAPILISFVGVPSVGIAQAQEKFKIGFSIEAMNGERWQTDLDSFQARARQLGAQVVSENAKGDDNLQLQQMKEMIQGGIQVLVLFPHDAVKAAAIGDAAKAANVKVISYDRLVRNSDVDLYITFMETGKMQAESLVQRVPKGNYVLIAGSPNSEDAKALHEAQMSVLQPYVSRGDIKIVADDYIQDWVPGDAYLAMLKTLDATHGDIAAVVSSNDGMAGAQGTQTMTIYKPIKQQASRAAEEAVRLARSEKPQGDIAVNNGKAKVPAILLKPVLVTRDNINSTVVKDGFQSLKSINQALPPDQQIK